MVVADPALLIDALINLQLWIAGGMLIIYVLSLFMPWVTGFTPAQLLLMSLFWPAFGFYFALSIAQVQLRRRQQRAKAESPNKTLN